MADQTSKATINPFIKRGVGKFDPEYRFAKQTREGQIPDIHPELGPCLIFTGASNGNGYGQFRFNDRNGYAHRYAWERIHGEIPDELTVDHLCMVRKCVRLSHLELIDGVTNFRRGRREQTHCRNGHEYTPDNLMPRSGANAGIRNCRECARNSWRKDAERKRKGTPSGFQRLYDRDAIEKGLKRYERGEVTLKELASEIGCTAKYLSKFKSMQAGAAWTKWKPAKKASKSRSAEEAARHLVRLRSGGVCERCGRAEAFEWHHRKNRSQQGEWAASNGLHLCSSCHRFVTEHPAEARAQGHCVRGWEDPADVPTLIWVNALAPKWFLLDDEGGRTAVGDEQQ